MEGSFKLSHKQAALLQEVETRALGLCVKDITMAVQAAVRGLVSPVRPLRGDFWIQEPVHSEQNLEPKETA